MASVFTRIIKGELPAHFVWKDARSVAFLSINPLKPGHTLVVPRKEVDHWIDVDDDLRNHLMTTARAIGRALHHVYHSPKVGLMLAGLEVPHLHIHLVPIWDVNDLDFGNAEVNPDPGSLVAASAKIRRALKELGYDDGVE